MEAIQQNGIKQVFNTNNNFFKFIIKFNIADLLKIKTSKTIEISLLALKYLT